jgi:hypothetical protein
MSAVVSFVEDTFDAVGDVFEAVGDVVEDVVDFVGDAVEKVGDVVEAIIEDPLPTLVAIGGQMIGIPAPITMGALTAARGGDLEDIALSMGTAYFAPQVGNAIAGTVSTTFIEAGLNETFSQVAADSISKGLVNGTVAEIKGGSFEDAFAGGFTGGMVSGGVSEVASYVKPDVLALAQESGIDLQNANAIFNAGTRAFSSGLTAEATGQGDFTTSFTNSAVGSTIDIGTRSLNATIDEQFRTAATDWNEKDSGSEPVEVAITGAGIPDEVVGQVTVSSIGVDNTASTIEMADVLNEYRDETAGVNNTTSSYTGEPPASEIAVLPDAVAPREQVLAQAPSAESDVDFMDLIGGGRPDYNELMSFDATGESSETPDSVADIAESLPTTAESVEPKGALATVAEAAAPAVELDTNKAAVVSEAPVAGDLLTAGLNSDQPTGGLNAVATQAATTTPQEKMASSMGIKPTDFTKPMVATVGNLLKQTLTKPKRPTPRAQMRPAGGLQMASARPAPRRPAAPPPRMDVASLIPIQKAAPTAPPKTLASTAKLSPVTNIAGLTSLVKKTG